MRMVTATLGTEAASEATRIAAARALADARDEDAAAQLEGDRPWVTIARGRKLRGRLGHRIVCLWRIALADASGVIVESDLFAVVAQFDRLRSPRRRRVLSQVVCALEARIQVELAGAIAEWQRTAAQSIRAFSSAHTERRRAVAAEQANMPQPHFQPGLFDRRAERAWNEGAGQAADTNADAAESLEASLSRAAFSPRPPQLLLVLVP
jgi:hypothetical protein